MDPSGLDAFGADSVSQEPQVETPSEQPDEGLANPFLAKIPSQDRAIVGKYIKEWDQGVSRKFEDWANKLKPYSELGTVDELRNYVNFINNFRQDPEAVFRLMWESMQQEHGENFEAYLMQLLELEGEEMSDEGFEQNGEYEQNGYQEEDPFVQNVTSELEQLRAFQQETQDRYVNEQLDRTLAMMHNQYGPFDDTWILTRLAEHGNVQQAINEWKQMIGQYQSNGATRQPPKVLGGQGGVPNEQVDTKALRGTQRRSAVEALLAQIGE